MSDRALRRQGVLAVSALLLSAMIAGAGQAREQVLYVIAQDKDGNPVTDLGAGDFLVREDGRPREVLRVTPATAPMAVAVLVDNSAAAEQDIPFMRDALKGFVAALTPQHQVALITIGERPTGVTDYTTREAELEKGIGRLFSLSGSGAYLLEALTESSRGIRRRENERAVIVAIHTEGPEFSTSYYDAVVDDVKRAGARLIVLTLVRPGGEVMTEEARQRGLAIDKGTRATGGYRRLVIANQSLPARLAQVAAQLLAEYRVVYARPEALIPPSQVAVEVKRAGVEAYGTPARLKGKP